MQSTLASAGFFPLLGDPLAQGRGRTDQAEALSELSAVKPAFVLPRLDEGAIPRGLLELNLRKEIIPTSQVCSELGATVTPGPASDAVEETSSVYKTAKNDVELDDLDFWSAAASFPKDPPDSLSASRREFKTWTCPQLPSVAATPSPFISESSELQIDALLPSVDAKSTAEYAQRHTLSSTGALHLLIQSILGATETAALKWDVQKSAFIWEGRVQGLGCVQSRSLSQTFLDVATCMRRLEMLCDRSHQQADTSTHHAQFHALSTYLTYIQLRLESAASAHLLHASQTLQDARQVLESLCEIMNWPLSSTSALPLSSQPVKIINSLYAHLAASLLVPTPIATPVQLAQAYLLERASQPWLDTVHQWVGLKPMPEDEEATNPWAIIGVEQHRAPAGHWEYVYHPKRVPAFVSKENGRRIFEAGRSLRLLARSTKGRHPLLGREWDDVCGVWPWNGQIAETDLENHLRRVRHLRHRSGARTPETPTQPPLAAAPALPFYAKSGLQDLGKPLQDNPLWKLFSAVPTNPGDDHPTQAQSSNLWQSTSSYDELHAFLDDHAGQPLIARHTPTLAAAIQADILSLPLAHGALASQSLLTHFLQDLKLLDHLAILRAFFLGGDVAFTDRVRAALFGDGQVDGQAIGVGRRARTRMRLGLGHAQDQVAAGDGAWGVGLAIGLSDRQCWPPGGTELSYALRTTLIDIEEKSVSAGTAGVSEEVWQEVDERLSFAVRDLEETDGEVQARWMDPQAIEALDFLYLSYDPPSVVSVLLTPGVIGKFQCVFSFLLRLSRVETVLRSVYNDIFHLVPAEEQPIKQGVDSAQTARRSRTPFASVTRAKHTLFRTQPSAQATLHRLRFRMSHVITSLSQYVLDSAISRNWDIFMRRMDRLKQNSRRSEAEEDDGFGLDEDSDECVPGEEINDIHALVLYHHHVLDRILKGCLLGPSAGQQALHRIMMGLFGVILDVGKLVKELAIRQVGEDDAVPKLEKLNASWCEREEMLLHVLEKLSARSGAPHRSVADEDEDLATLLKGEDGNDAARFDGGLGELLLRLQLGKPQTST